MMDLEIRALKKRTLSRKLSFFAKKEKENVPKKESKPASKSSNIWKTFALFKDTPEKLLDFSLPTSFTQLRKKPSYYSFSQQRNQNSMNRRKRIYHHEESYPLFSRI